MAECENKIVGGEELGVMVLLGSSACILESPRIVLAGTSQNPRNEAKGLRDF